MILLMNLVLIGKKSSTSVMSCGVKFASNVQSDAADGSIGSDMVSHDVDEPVNLNE